MENAEIPAYLLAIRERLTNNLSAFLHEQDLASDQNVSVSKLQKDFAHYFGLNFQDFQTETKMQAAAKLLTESRQSIKRISRNLGYNSPEAFSRAFRKFKGKTPSLYRKNH